MILAARHRNFSPASGFERSPSAASWTSCAASWTLDRRPGNGAHGEELKRKQANKNRGQSAPRKRNNKKKKFIQQIQHFKFTITMTN